MGKQRLTQSQQLLVDRIEEALSHAKTELGKTKAQVALECNVTAQALNNWLRRGTISKQSMTLLAEATQVNPLWLYTGKGGIRPVPAEIKESEYPAYQANIDKHLMTKSIEHVFSLFLEETSQKKASELAKYVTAYYFKLSNGENILDTIAELQKNNN